mgnify:CR=1 FL=1
MNVEQVVFNLSSVELVVALGDYVRSCAEKSGIDLPSLIGAKVEIALRSSGMTPARKVRVEDVSRVVVELASAEVDESDTAC